ncbi:glycerate kinase [Planctomycetota bacterium]|nr:glycerate kinase [Planctomycetota bacterium]
MVNRKLRVLVSPDSFKESLAAVDVAAAMERGVKAACEWKKVEAVVDLCPVADGGEGTVDALVTAMGGEVRIDEVSGPLGERVEAKWGLCGDVGVIEMAEAAGLGLVPSELRNPMTTTTYGVGELIECAMKQGVKRIVMGIGGSATNDGGCGMAQALGVAFLGEGGEEIEGVMCGEKLGEVRRVVMPEGGVLGGVRLDVACDVKNVLCGLNGAAMVYGPQKGADVATVKELDTGLGNLGEVMKRDLGVDVRMIAGAGAAGGLGGGAMAMLGGELQSGIDLVLDAVGFAERVKDVDLVLTGEGKMDGQSLEGKVVWGVTQMSRRYGQEGVKVWAGVGCVGAGVENIVGDGKLSGYVVVSEGHEIEWAMAHTAELVEEGIEDVVKGLL